MKTPLFFKLLLLLALGLKLIRANKKSVKLDKPKNLNLFNTTNSIKIEFNSTIIEGNRIWLKRFFRDHIRIKDTKDYDIFYDLPNCHRHLMLAYHLEIAIRKNNLYHFIWHHNYWILAIYQQLKAINLLEYSNSFEKILIELNNEFNPKLNIETLVNMEFDIEGDKKYESIETFNKVFDFEVYLETLLIFLKNESKTDSL